MHPILLYLLKMLLCSGILYAYYRIALYNEKFHQWNRFYLLAALLLSLVVPLMEITLVAEEQPQGLIYVIETLPATIVAKAAPSITTEQLGWGGMFLVSLILLCRLLWGMYQTIYIPYRNGDVSSREEIDVVITETPSAPYSFFRLLFWRSDLDPDSPYGKRVLQHELTHIREKHSTDKLFVELLLVVCWFNPFFWLIRKELYIIHEFLADRKAIEQNNGAAFAEMILQTMNATHLSPITNPFFSSHIKRRLKMITTSNKPQFSYLRRISALAAMVTVSFVLMLTIEKGIAQQAPPTPAPPPAAPPPPPPPPKMALPDSIKSIAVNTVNGKSIVTITLKNGTVRKMQVDEAIKKGYPVPPPPPPAPPAPLAPPSPQSITPDQIEQLTLDEVAGKVWVKLKDKTFFDLPLLQAQCLLDGSPEKVVKKQVKGWDNKTPPIIIYAGLEITQEQMAQIEPNNIEQINILKGEQAIAAYGERAKDGVIVITPKKEAYTKNTNNGQRQNPKDVVVVGYGKKPPTNSTETVKIVGTNKFQSENPPLFVVNGKIISQEELNALDPNTIQSVNVWKDQQAIDKYGEKAKYGAIDITLKKKGDPSTQGDYNKIFIKAEQMPEFPGGGQAWTRHLQRNLRYPDKAVDDGTQGVAKVSFIVDMLGNLSDFEIVENPGNGLGEEALRVIKDGPKWEPAEQNGKLVNAKVTQAITFRLE